LTGHRPFLAGLWPVSGRYFEPWLHTIIIITILCSILLVRNRIWMDLIMGLIWWTVTLHVMFHQSESTMTILKTCPSAEKKRYWKWRLLKPRNNGKYGIIRWINRTFQKHISCSTPTQGNFGHHFVFQN
jgi:hypothetical protein